MYKQSPSRNNRSKGIKVKHILQICLLLVVCFWLIYQVKRSHEKREELDTNDEKAVEKVKKDVDIIRFGRKDLPRVTETATDVEVNPHDEEEKEADEEENKHDEDEPEIEDTRIQDRDDEDVDKGGGDDEVDENEPEKAEHEDDTEKNEAILKKTESEHAHEEEQEDEDKDREENEGESEEKHTENEESDDVGKDRTEDEEDEGGSKAEGTEDDDVVIEKQVRDLDGGSRSTHEAREEQYKADDASSEVTHDRQTISQTGNMTTGHTNDVWNKVNFGQLNETLTLNNVEEVNSNLTSTNITKDNPFQNSTMQILDLEQPKNSSDSTDHVGEVHLGFLLSTDHANMSQIATTENATIYEKTTLSEDLHKSELAYSNRTENVHTSTRESLMSNDTSASYHNTNNTDPMSVESDGSSIDNLSDEDTNTIQHDPIDASDTTTLTQEEKEIRMDLDTLPEIKTEVQNIDDVVAE